MKLSEKAILQLFLSTLLTTAFNVTAISASSSYVVVAMAGSTPTIDGLLDPGEWSDAASVEISITSGANATVYSKQDSINLYIGLNIADATFHAGDSCIVIFDVDHDKSRSLLADDRWIGVSSTGAKQEYNVTAGGWYPTTVSGWTVMASSTADGWQAEYNITFQKFNISVGVDKTIGVMLLILDKDVGGYYVWPSDASITSPATWGEMVVDVTPPTVFIVSPGNKTYRVKDVSLAFIVSEEVSWIGYALDDRIIVTVSGNASLVGLSEGAHTLTVYANDTVRNRGGSKTVSFAVDSISPNVRVLSPENQTYTTSSVSLNFTVDEVASWIGYSLDGRMNVTVSGNTTLSGLSEGAHSLIVYARDVAGNTGTSEVVWFSVTGEREFFPAQIVGAVIIVTVVGSVLLVYFRKFRKREEATRVF